LRTAACFATLAHSSDYFAAKMLSQRTLKIKLLVWKKAVQVPTIL